jgi:hypothetical protein
MISYAKVLELGLKHDPIENPENYSWTQIDDMAVCGPPVNGRKLDLPDFNLEMSTAISEFVDTQRAKLGNDISFMIIATNDNSEEPKADTVSGLTGNYMNLAEGLFATIEKDQNFKMAFTTVGILNMLNKRKEE